MVSFLLGALFAVSGLLAAAVMVTDWRRYGSAFAGLRAGLANVSEVREVRVRISEVKVRSTATVLRPVFTGRSAGPSRAALPAAA